MRLGRLFCFLMWPGICTTSSLDPSKNEEFGIFELFDASPASSSRYEWLKEGDFGFDYDGVDRALEVFGPCVEFGDILEQADSQDVISFECGAFETLNNQTSRWQYEVSGSAPPESHREIYTDTSSSIYGPVTSRVLSLGSPNNHASRKRKIPQTSCLTSIMISFPNLDLDGIVSLLGDETQRETVNRIMNLRLMPVSYMEVIERMMRQNSLVRPFEIAREIRITVGPAPAYWISFWMEKCLSPNGQNSCRDRITVTLNDDSRIECFYMDSQRWIELLQLDRISSRAGVDLEAGPPQVRHRVVPNLEESHIHDIVVAHLQANLRSSPARILATISQAGGSSDLETIMRIKKLIERKFVAPVWFHNYLMMNRTVSPSKILTWFFQNINVQERFIWDFVLTGEKISEWRRFCIDGSLELIHNRCREITDPRTGEVIIQLTNDQKRVLLTSL
jgi:hypothetical protein